MGLLDDDIPKRPQEGFRIFTPLLAREIMERLQERLETVRVEIDIEPIFGGGDNLCLFESSSDGTFLEHEEMGYSVVAVHGWCFVVGFGWCWTVLDLRGCWCLGLGEEGGRAIDVSAVCRAGH